jgi:hypothetical protein
MPLLELGRRLWNQALQRRLGRGNISLENISNTRDATNTLAGRIKTMQIRLVKNTLKSASHSWETESLLYLNLSIRATSLKVK